MLSSTLKSGLKSVGVGLSAYSNSQKSTQELVQPVAKMSGADDIDYSPTTFVKFLYDNDKEKLFAFVVDRKTNEVIRQMSDQETLALIEQRKGRGLALNLSI